MVHLKLSMECVEFQAHERICERRCRICGENLFKRFNLAIKFYIESEFVFMSSEMQAKVLINV